ncbi:MAG TPA: nucleoside 2-deoxyribosyltransferase [Pseudonocardiaceae bacterium]|jgi:nucleoside 2-deoxyribosyltransferase
MTATLSVYLAASILGGRDYATAYRTIADQLAAETATLLSPQVLDPAEDNGLTEAQVYDRDVAALNRADCLVAEISQPSLGVGFEIAYAVGLARPVLALYDTRVAGRVSAMVLGCRQVRTVAYRDESAMRSAVHDFLCAIRTSL